MQMWLESAICEWDGYVIRAYFPHSKRTRFLWPLNDDGTNRGAYVGRPCWNREAAMQRYETELGKPFNRGLHLDLVRYRFNTCRHTLGDVVEIVHQMQPARYQ